MTDRKVMQQALEALEGIHRVTEYPKIQPAVAALRKALEQPEQEPVAWAIYDRRGGSKSLHWHESHTPDGDATKFDAVPLYTTPPAAQPEQVDCPRCGHVCSQRPWQGLTDEVIWEIHDRCIPPTEGYVSPVDFARTIEAKLKEKHT